MAELTNNSVNKNSTSVKVKKRKKHNVNSWGYIFIIPFFIAFICFQLIPLGETVFYSFFEYYYKLGLTKIGPNFNWFKNYVNLLGDKYFWKYLWNTIVLWIIGAVPQFVFALLLAVIFTDLRLKIKGQRFFKAVMYMPNLVMASAFGMLFLMLTGQNGPISQICRQLGIMSETFKFIESKAWCRIIIAFINFLMWFGNTTLLLISGIIGIDESVFESARIDGSNSWRMLKDITFPLLLPIFVYTFITSMIGGIQLFDAAQIFTQTTGGPDHTSYTIMMYLFNLINGPSRNYGMAGALSTILFIVTGILSFVVFKTLTPSYNAQKQEMKSKEKRKKWLSHEDKEYALQSFEKGE